MSKYLCLDDYRKVEECTIKINGAWGGNRISLLDLTKTTRNQWDLVKSYEEFVEYIEKNCIPENVSFDNDLLEPHYLGNYSDNKTGLDCLVYLINKCKELNRELPICFVHSFNKERREVMEKMIEEYKI